MKNETKINYRLYARKSSVAEDKQVLSIASQIDELKKIIADRKIVLRDEDIMREEHSAKTAYTRPVFEQLIKDIDQGKVQAIIGWHPNRFARNAVDAARLIEQMDLNKLVEIVTPSQTYRNTPQDKFFFTMLCSQAKMENDSKGIDVKRGLRRKNQMGHPGGVAKPGYKNDYGKKGERRVLVDPERFGLVKQLLEMFLTGKHSVRALLKYSNEVMGFKTIQRTKEGGAPLQLSQLYRMLKDPYYAGFFYGKDENDQMVRYEVNQEISRMITEEQYWQIQSLLGRKGIPCPSTNRYTFPYTGKTRCGTCGCSVVAENKHQLICPTCRHKFAYKNREDCPSCHNKISEMNGATYLHYMYYHCSKKRDVNCPERSVHQSTIDTSIAEFIEENLSISQPLSDWCIERLDEMSKNDKQNEYERKAAWVKQKEDKECEYDQLVQMRMKGLIDDDTEFLRLKATLKADIQRIDVVLADMGGANLSSIEKARDVFVMMVGLSKAFRGGSFEDKQEALSVLGSNLTLKDKKLNISTGELFSTIAKGLLEAKQINPRFEPEKYGPVKDETEAFASVRPTLLRG